MQSMTIFEPNQHDRWDEHAVCIERQENVFLDNTYWMEVKKIVFDFWNLYKIFNKYGKLINKKGRQYYGFIAYNSSLIGYDFQP